MVPNPGAVGAPVASALNGTAVAVQKIDAKTYKVFYQSIPGDVMEQIWSDGRGEKPKSIFKAKSRSPLAVVEGWGGGKESARVYSVSKENYLQEWAYQDGTWESGDLIHSKIHVTNTKLAAVSWMDRFGVYIRLYCQDPTSNHIQEYGSGPWRKLAQLPYALPGTGLAAIAWKDSGYQTPPKIRLYYQAQDSSLLEHKWGDNWSKGNFSVPDMQYNTSIAATITSPSYSSSAEGPHIYVYGQTAEQYIVRFSQCAWEMHMEPLLGPLHPAASFSVPQYAPVEDTRSRTWIHYQADDLAIKAERAIGSIQVG